MNTTPSGFVAPPVSRARARTDLRAWYYHPWLWFVIALPAISVVFSFATLYIAVTHADVVVPHEKNEAVYALPDAPRHGDPAPAPAAGKNAAATVAATTRNAAATGRKAPATDESAAAPSESERTSP